MQLEQIVAHYGLWALGLGAGVEGETVVVLGGVMVHRGLLPMVPAMLVAAFGSFVADQTFFAAGRRFRDHAFVRRAQARPTFRRALAQFDRHPVLFVFAFRFLYGLRTVSPLAIGTTSLPAGRFLLVNAAAALLWGAVFVTVGFFFGQAFEAAFGRIRRIEHVVLPLVGMAIVIAAGVSLWRRRRATTAAG